MKLVWSSKFTRAAKKLSRRKPALFKELDRALAQIEIDPHHPSLRTHKLSGEMAGSWACSAGYDFRIIFEFVRNPATKEGEIHLLSVGTHDEVY